MKTMRFSHQQTVSVLLVCLSFRCSPGQVSATAENAPMTLKEAIQRAQANEPSYATAVAGSQTAKLDRLIAQSALLPSVDYHNQGLYTQPSVEAGRITSQSTPRFIANNAVREYTSQGIVNETIGLGLIADLRHASAAEMKAAAEQEIARRGLVVTVTELYYGVLASDHRVTIAEGAHREAVEFLTLTQKREAGREAAHADVVKAQLEELRSNRELSNGRLNAEKARLELGVLLFSDPRTRYTLADAESPAPPGSLEEVKAAASRNTPELKSALATEQESEAEVLSARAAYLPSIGLNYTYGIDAPQFAINGPDHTRYLGYSASVTADLPVWDWLATQHKVKQSEIRRTAARVALTNAQRQMIAHIEEVYSEAVAAHDQLSSLDASVQTAEESLRLSRLRYEGGEATALEVVDAQTAYVDAENAREDGRVRFQVAMANLQTLTGTM
jgi:outer membrane protein TolC